MTEALAALARIAQIASGCALVGWLLFQDLHDQVRPATLRVERRRWPLIWLAATFVLAGVVALACQSALVTGRDEAAYAVDDWWQLATGTLFGRVWWAREGLMLCVVLLGGLVPWTSRSRELMALLAGTATAAGAASGHAAALESPWLAMLAQAIHLAALGIWWGALLPLSAALRREGSAPRFAAMLKAFSQRASWTMTLILASGAYLAWQHVDRWPALFGTPYGQWLLLKLVLIAAVLLLAARLRWHWLPAAQRHDIPLPVGAPAKLVAFEWAVALLVISIAVVLAQTPPGRHAQVDWPFAFRFAPAFAWAQPGTVPRVLAGAVMGCAALALVVGSRGWKRRAAARGGACLLSAMAAALILPPLTVPAFPDTYRSSEVPYHAISIHNGARLFRQHCTECHGAGALGDGPRAASLARPPADLSAPHTADHTAGDMFWWLSHGMPSGAMPGFSDQLDEESRWDLINYLRAFSSGYQGRIIRPEVARQQPWLGAPDLNYGTQHGASGSLRELRGRRAALLVFYRWPQSQARLRDLAAALPLSEVFVLAIPWNMPPGPIDATLALPVVTQGAEEASSTYALLRRTLARADSGDRAPLPSHMEVLIDRFGYIRARWLPEESEDWRDIDDLRRQLRLLAAEPEILPPPDEHIH